MRYFLTILFLLSHSGSFSQNAGSSFVSKAKYTNKQVVWYEYDYWLDGSRLSDAKNKNRFNDVLFKKVGNKYYKAQVEGAFNVDDWGIKRDFEGGKPEENSTLIQAMIDYFPEGYTPSIYMPSGTYRFARAIIVKRKPIYLFGDNGTIWGNSTKLYFPYNSDGLRVDRAGQATQETVIERICLIGSGGDGSAGNGIHSNARIKLRHVTMKGFSQNGLLIWANMEEGGDASGSSIEYCHSLENGHDGFLAGRVDANAITFIGNDARDNGRYGFNDDSFLGNNFISCMAHYNKAGDFFVRDKGNARSLFQGCYSEGGNKVSDFSGKTIVVGGIWGTGYTKDGGKTILY